MELSALAHWAEIIAAVAIVVSLIFVGYEVAQNNRLTRLQFRRNAIADLRAFKTLSTDPKMADILCRGRVDYQSLTKTEKLMLQDYMEIAVPAIIGLTLFRNFTSVGVDNTKDFAARNMQSLIDHPGIRQWWAETRQTAAIGPPGRAELDRLIGQAGQQAYAAS